eukprot:669891-Pelagomonas_calceolata.AAC.1
MEFWWLKLGFTPRLIRHGLRNWQSTNLSATDSLKNKEPMLENCQPRRTRSKRFVFPSCTQEVFFFDYGVVIAFGLEEKQEQWIMQ